jgi:G3E family GTPase
MSIALNVITGFLGSGKTTLLKRLLQGESLGDTALLINEFGDVGIDHLLVEEVAPDTVLLPSGCVCCSIRGELKDALLGLLQRRERGEIPAFKRVILETTGLADPAPILATLNNDVQLRGRFHVGLVITLVDASHAALQERLHPEWLAQVAAADRMLLSKTDLAGDAGAECRYADPRYPRHPQRRSTAARRRPAQRRTRRGSQSLATAPHHHRYPRRRPSVQPDL